jgi:SAM-dependent methyltransferase
LTYLKDIYLRLTYDFWRRTLPKYGISAGDVTVLECGIGPGHLFRLMEGWFPQASFFGLDADPHTLYEVRQKNPQKLLVAASAETLPFPEKRFDFIISLHMVEHLHRPDEFLKEAVRVLRPDGILVLATPNPHGLGAKIMKSRWDSWIPEHISLQPPRKWRQLLTDNGFKILRNGTTGLSGIPVFRKLPLAIFNWVPLFAFGYFPWDYGEAYTCIACKEGGPLGGVPRYQKI